MKSDKPVNRSRLMYFDMVKGFAIICIILGHIEVPWLQAVVFSFHVPLFLTISGYFFSDTKPLSIRLSRLLRPYIFTAIVLVLIELAICIFVSLTRGESDLMRRVGEVMLAGIYGGGLVKDVFGYQMPSVGAIWFLLALGWSTAILWWMVRMRFSKAVCLCISAALAALAIWSAHYVWLPFSVQAGMMSVLFVYLGYLARQTKWHENIYVIVLSAIIWAVSLYYNITHATYLKVVDCTVPNLLLDIPGSVAACIVIVALCRWVERIGHVSQVLVMFGQASLVVLCFHLIELNYIHGRLEYYLTEVLGWGTMLTFTVLITYKLCWAWLWIKIHSKSKFLQRYM